jgi:NodT family efflux transporter outer membrane factor (OMF) lipoprotein
LNNSAQRSRSPGGRGGGASIGNSFALNEQASWSPDLWGRIRRTVEGNVASAQASAGDLASARLAAQGQLASDYLQLRIADELRRLLEASARAYGESLRIVRNQNRAGVADPSAVAQAQAQYDSTRAQMVAVGVTRAQLEHAIAVLIGKPPAQVTIAATTKTPAIPGIPPEMPAALLQRRPDIAAAERRVAAANADIGVVEAAFFPDVTLSAEAGTAAETIAKLLTASARVWSLGGSLVQTIFDAGANQARVAEARAAYDATVADYRQIVLTALQQVEDELAALRILAEQAAAQNRALAAAREAERIINNQYRAGTVAYTNVIVAQTTALSDAVTALNIRQSRLIASVALIQAVGGGWNASQLPDRERIERDQPLTFNPFPPADALPKLK